MYASQYMSTTLQNPANPAISLMHSWKKSLAQNLLHVQHNGPPIRATAKRLNVPSHSDTEVLSTWIHNLSKP